MVYTPRPIEMTSEERKELIGRIKSNMSTADADILLGLIDFNLWLQHSLEEKNISIDRLRRTFGSTNEKRKSKDGSKSSNKLNNPDEPSDAQHDDTVTSEQSNSIVEEGNIDENPSSNKPETSNLRKQGTNNGKLGHEAYTGAEVIVIKAPYKPGDPCPEEDCTGKLYPANPGNVIKIVGQSFGKAIKYVFENLRCNLCGSYFSGEMPKHVCQDKYDPTFKAELCVHKYFLGVPSYRLESYQSFIGVPLPDSTQYEKMEDVANIGYPVFLQLEKYGANGYLVHGDDTTVRIQTIIAANKGVGDKARTGMFTTGIISFYQEHQIHLFYSGRKHCGENMAALLSKRDSDLPPIKYMCDALASNMSTNLRAIIINCLIHCRRNFTDIDKYYPEECTKVIGVIAAIYRHDDEARTQKLNDEERLIYHQQNSSTLMEDLRVWLQEQLDAHRVEPNSSLGAAFKYTLKHWHELTQFLRVPGAPLDNNIIERGLKIAIRVRKNSLFYGTEHSAYIGSLLQSLIGTCIAAKQNPIKYLTALQDYKVEVRIDPSAWLPWNYQETIAAKNKKELIELQAA